MAKPVFNFGLDMIVSILFLLILYSTYRYLGRLDNCNCVVNQQSVHHLKNIELFFIIVASIGIMLKLFGCMCNVSLSMIKKIPMILYGSILYILICLSLYAYFVYNAYNFIITMPSNCKCAQKWQKYVIYTQSIIYFMILFSIFYLIIKSML